MIEILNLRKTVNGYLANGLIELSDTDESVINWLLLQKEVMPILSEAEMLKALVPSQLTPRQFKQQLFVVGLLDEVEAVCATDRMIKIWFDESLDFQRTSEILIEKSTMLGMSESDMDNFFIEASKL